MKDLRLLVLGGILAGIAALFQIIPVIFTETLIIFTIFSALPIYIISRVKPKFGFISYIVSGILILLFSYHESILFMFTNGLIGLALGICSHYIKVPGKTNNKKSQLALELCYNRTEKIFRISLISAIILTISLSILNYLIGIPIFGTKLPGNMIIQLIIILAFSLLYCTIYLYFSKFMFKKLNKYYILDDNTK